MLGTITDGRGCKSALVLIDLQNDMIHPHGAYGAGGFAELVAKRGLLENVSAVLDTWRASGSLVCHVRLGYRSDYADCLSRAPRVSVLKERKAAILGEWGAELHEAVAAVAGERVFEKQSVNPFWNTQLLNWLYRTGITQVALCGVATHLAIESAARFADDAGLEVSVLEDCCAAANMEVHRFAIENTLPLFGKVLSSKDFIAHVDMGEILDVGGTIQQAWATQLGFELVAKEVPIQPRPPSPRNAGLLVLGFDILDLQNIGAYKVAMVGR